MAAAPISSRGGVAENIRVCPSMDVPVDIAYEVFGEMEHPNAAAVVLISGLGCSKMMYATGFCEQLAAAGPFRVVRFDNRDTGFSTKMDQKGDPSLVKLLLPKWLVTVTPVYTLEDMADDTAALLAHLGIAAAHVVGASMGGMIAQLVAIRHRTLTLSLTSLMSTTGGPSLPDPPMWVKLEFLHKPKSDSFADRHDFRVSYERRICWAGEERVDAATAAYIDAQQRAQLEYTMYRLGFARQLVAIARCAPREALLRAVTAPALVVHGKLDLLCLFAHGERTAACLPGCAFVVEPELGHVLPGDERHWGRVIAEIVKVSGAPARIV
jgi:pimeloyl-ACP methyl ester carboxylesterase